MTITEEIISVKTGQSNAWNSGKGGALSIPLLMSMSEAFSDTFIL